MARNLFVVVASLVIAATLGNPIAAFAQDSAEATAEANRLDAAPPADINDTPALPPPDGANDGTVKGPALNTPDRSLLRSAQEEVAPEPNSAPQEVSREQPSPSATPGSTPTDSAAQPQDGQQAPPRGGILFGRMTDQGLPIERVAEDSVFYRSGLRAGDVIVSLGRRPIRSAADFSRAAGLTPGRRVPVVVLRNGAPGTIQVEFPPEIAAGDRGYEPRRVQSSAYLGVEFNPQTRDFVVVQRVNGGSPAAKAGLQANDIILALNDEEVRAIPDAIAMIRGMRPGDELQILVERSRAQHQIVATLDAAAIPHTVSRPTTMDNQDGFGGARGETERDANRADENDGWFRPERENGGANNRNRDNAGGRGFRRFRFRN